MRYIAATGPKIINGQNSEGWTPLHLACDIGNLEVVEWLLDRKADPNIPNFDGKTPLAKAAEFGDLQIVKLLVEHKANVNFQADEVSK